MAIVQTQGSFNIGRDCTIIVQHPLAPGGRLQVPNITGFQCSQQVASVNVDRLDGVQVFAELPKGWTGSFMADRGSSGIDDLFALIEAAWYAAGGTVTQATIFQYITEADGSLTTWQFTSVSMHAQDPGSWHGDQVVKQSVNFRAARRIRA